MPLYMGIVGKIRFIFNEWIASKNPRGNLYDVVLDERADLSSLYFKCALYYFVVISQKLFVVVDSVFFQPHGHIPHISDDLNDRYRELWGACQKLAQRQDFKDMHILNPFGMVELFGDGEQQSASWRIDRDFVQRTIEEISTHVLQVYELPYDIQHVFQEIDKLLEDKAIRFWVRYYPNGKIILNDSYLLGRPHIASENDEFFDYVYHHPNTHITRQTFQGLNRHVIKHFGKIIYELGFRKALVPIFFPKVSESSVYFHNDITERELQSVDVNIQQLEQQLAELKRVER